MNEELQQYGLKTNVIDTNTLHEVARKVLNKAASAVATTYGPSGSHSMYTQLPREAAKFTKDGISVLEGIYFQGALEHSIFKFVLETSRKVNKLVGDGTTTAFLATDQLYQRFLKALLDNEFVVNGKPVRPHKLSLGLRMATGTILDKIRKNATLLETDDQNKLMEIIKHIAFISLNNDIETTEVLMQAYEKVGINGDINVEISPDDKYSIQTNSGYRLDYGFFSSVFTNSDDNNAFEAENTKILLFNGTPNNLEHEEMIKELINKHNQEGIAITFIVGDLSTRMSGYLHKVFHFAKQNVSRKNVINIVQIPMHTKDQQERVLDLSILLGAKIINVETSALPGFEEMDVIEYHNIPLKEKIQKALETLDKEEYFGSSKIVSYSDYTLFSNVKGEKNPLLQKRLEDIISDITRKLAEPNRKDLDLVKLRTRKAFLENSLVTLFVGGETDAVKTAKADLFDDAIRAIRASKEFGFNRGCNLDIILACQETIEEIDKLIIQSKEADIETIESFGVTKRIIEIIQDSFKALYKILLDTYFDIDEKESILKSSIANKTPFDVTSFVYNPNIINPTLTDLIVLDTAISVVADLLTTKQFLLSTIEDNIYTR